MTMLENTISMMKTLQETDLAKIQSLTKKLFQHHECETVDKAVGKFLKPMSREDFLSDIETAEQEIADGKYKPAKEVWNELENPQAMQSVEKDMKETAERLSHTAGSLKLCDDKKFRAKGYRTIHFKYHRYFMLYKIVGKQAYVVGIYHDLQDYENALR